MTRSEPASPERAARDAAPDDASIAEAFRHARRHSRAVRAAKILLPGSAALIAIGFFAYSYLFTPGGISVDLAGSGFKNGKLVMANPKLDGFTRDNRPYSMHAARAVQAIGDSDAIELDQIAARLPMDSHNWATVNAAKGIYDRGKNTLDITSPLTVETTSGLTAKLQSAFVEIGSGNLRTSEPVDIKLEGSHIKAQSLEVRDHGSVLIFDKGVRVTIQPDRIRTAEAESGESGNAGN